MAKFEIKDGVAIIPDTVKEIGDYAFFGCSRLPSVARKGRMKSNHYERK